MITGMMWFDNDPKTNLPQKIDRAARYYRKKYGEAPNLCYVNPKMMADSKPENGKVNVKTSANILPFHIWIGSTENTLKEKN